MLKCLVITAFVGLVGCSSSATSIPAASDSSLSIRTATTTVAAPVAAPADAVSVSVSDSVSVEKPVFDAGAVGHATVTGPITSGKGVAIVGVSALDLASVGYMQEEFFVSGTASAYQADGSLSADGRWSVRRASTEPFTTRIVVRRPINAQAFNGSVAVEWLNVSSGFDTAPDWTMGHTELIRSGWVWVGVTAQAVALVGRPKSLAPSLVLKTADPERYAPLTHPGDSYSYDIFSQAGAVLHTDWQLVLAGLEPQRVIALGESQSAFRLTTYIDAIAPLANVFAGFLVHSRASAGAALSEAPQPVIDVPKPTLIRTDLATPVLTVLTETDMITLGNGASRQPDTDMIRSWEMPGTAHADVYGLGVGDTDNGSGAADVALFAALTKPPSAIYGGIITCDSGINAGGQTYVYRSALAALDAWATTRVASPPMPRMQLTADNSAVVTDDLGNGVGGVRTPQVDVPVAALSGSGQTGTTFCALFGTTQPFNAAKLAALYPNHDAFVAKWNAAVDKAVSTGAVLAVDAVNLRAAALASTIANPS